MQRVLARVIDLKRMSEEGAGSDFSVQKVLLKVKIEDKAAKGFKLPPRTKGRIHWVVRESVRPWTIAKGDRVVLDPEEVRSLLSPLRLEPPIAVSEKGKVTLLLSFDNPLGKSGLRWRVQAEGLGEEKEGSFDRANTAKLNLRIQGIGEGAYPVVAECGGFQAEAVVPIITSGSTLSYLLDVNSDGFDEVVLENGYVRAVIMPHLGGRLASLYYKATGTDKFSSWLEYGKNEYTEFGGSQEVLGREPPGDLWDAEFKMAELGSASVLLTHKWKGLEVEKRVELLPSMPVVHQRVSFSSKGGGGKEVAYSHRMGFAVGERPWMNTLLIPTKEKVERTRYHPPYGWHRDPPHYGLKFGGLLFCSEDKRESLLCLTEPDTVECAQVSFTRKGLICSMKRKPIKLKKGDSISFSSLYVLGGDHSIDEGSLAIVSRGQERRGRVPIFVCLRSSEVPMRVPAELSLEERGRRIKLAEVGLEGVGELWVGSRSHPASAKVSAEIFAEGSRHSLTSLGREDV